LGGLMQIYKKWGRFWFIIEINYFWGEARTLFRIQVCRLEFLIHLWTPGSLRCPTHHDEDLGV